MDATAAIIEFVLRKHGIDAFVVGNPDCVVKRICSYRENAREPGVLYVAEGAMPHKKPAAKSACAVLWARPAQTARNAGKRSANRKPAGGSHTTLFEEACAALREVDLWDSKLKDALINRVPLDEFMQIGTEMFTCPIAYFDRNLITLAASEDYWTRDDASESGSLVVSGQMPSNRAIDLVDDHDYLDAASKQKPFYYENARNRFFLGINTFDGDEYLARLVLALPVGEATLHPGEERLAVHYHRYLDDLYLHYAGNVDVVSSQNNALHTLARASLLEGHIPPIAEVASILGSFGWANDDDYIVAKLVFFEGVHWDSISLYLCGLLERAVDASCAFPVERQIVWLVNLTRSAKPYETRSTQMDRIVETLVSMMRDYACKTGISDEFSALANSRSHFLEAERALDIGQIRDPHYWYYRFSDYAFDYMLAKSTEELPGELLCHPALSELRAYDATHATEYARTLVCFLRNSQNTTHAADELFIHRTSFMRRMAQIRNLTEVDLNNPDEVLHLLLSAKLLGM